MRESQDGKTGSSGGVRDRVREEMRRKGEKVSFFTLGAQTSILNTKVYQSKLSLEFAASLIFSHLKPFPLSPTFTASTFPPAKTLK